MKSKERRLSRTFTIITATLLASCFGLGAVIAGPAVSAWQAKDAKGRTVNTANYKGKVQIVTISNPDYNYKKATDKALAFIASEYGESDDVAQLTLIDLRGMNSIKYKAAEVSGELDKRLKKAHNRIAGRIAKALGKTDGASKKKIDAGLHLIPVRGDKIVNRYSKQWDDNVTENNLILLVVDKNGNYQQGWKIKKNAPDSRINAVLKELKSVVDKNR